MRVDHESCSEGGRVRNIFMEDEKSSESRLREDTRICRVERVESSRESGEPRSNLNKHSLI